MQLTRTRTTEERDSRQSFFLTAYRDHLLTELAEVERRLAESNAGAKVLNNRAAIGLES